ncbi:MAG: diaminopimelate epimerase [Lachnospiraceae bacterium]|nr:diaminopimelate epimerase [Lachnospiraceae bacterium]
MSFTKMQGCGNDYVYVNAMDGKYMGSISELAIKISDRHFGVGSDGLILIKPSKFGDFFMDMYNNDGSRGKMCGNGIRCVAKFVYDHKLTDKTHINIETLSGMKEIDLILSEGEATGAKVDMGEPQLLSEFIPCKCKKEECINETITVDGKDYTFTAVSMGNPHCVIFMDEDVEKLDLAKIGPMFEKHDLFPDSVNTEFVNVIDRTHLRMRVWERGTGETLACGTGTCATVVAAVLNGYCDNTVDVKVDGGELEINWEGRGKNVIMTGPAVTVFEGTYEA